VPYDGEHRREQLVLRRVADHLMEARVLFRVRLAGGDLALLRGEYFAQLGELHIGDASRGERGERRLDQTAELDDIGNAVAAGDEAVERSHEIVGRDLADERAATRARFDHAEQLEGPQRFPDGGARNLELLRQGALGRELVARSELALFEERLDLLDDALVEPAAPDGLDNGQFGPPSNWSGGLTSTQKRLRRFGRTVKGSFRG